MAQTYQPVTSSKMTTTTMLCAYLALTFTAILAVPLDQPAEVGIQKEYAPESAPQLLPASNEPVLEAKEQPELPVEVQEGAPQPGDLPISQADDPVPDKSDLETANTFWGYPSYGYNRGYGGYGGGWRRGWGNGWGNGWGSGYGGYRGYGGGYGGWGWGGHRGYGGWGGRGWGGGHYWR